MKQTLSEDIISSEDLRSVIDELKDYQDYVRHDQIKAHLSKHASSTSPELSRPAASLIADAMEHHPLNHEEMMHLIAELEKIYASSPKVKIVLAAIPNHAIKKQITLWARANVDPEILIDFSYNQSLLGGMVVTAGSHIYDWSLRRQVLANQPKLYEMIAHV